MAYGLLATSASTINAAKGRAAGQAVAASLHDEAEWQRLVPSIDVPPAALAGVIALLDQRLSVLLPLRREVPHPPWLGPAVRDGQLCLFNGRWARTAALWERFPRLFGSSANLTGRAPAASAAQAIAMLGVRCPVVEVRTAGDPPRRRLASTIIRVDRGGRIALHRAGIHTAMASQSPDTFLRQLADAVGLTAEGSATAKGESP
jgi:tRNA A37 threonylcarbamoyladenosine synthetase subunit TsaC/SUA5/YrdC